MADEDTKSESSPEVCDALLEWFRSFDNITSSCDDISDLCDGVVCYQAMSHIAPMFFDNDTLVAADSENHLLAVSNTKRLLADLDTFYVDGLGLSADRVRGLSAEEIATEKNPAQVQCLAELVLAAAALSEDNTEYIRTIMEMEPQQQRCLVPIIEEAMAGGHGQEDERGRSDSFADSVVSDDMDGSGSEAGGIGAHNDDLTRRIMALEHDNQVLKAENDTLKAQVDTLKAEAKGNAAASDTATSALDREQRARERQEEQTMALTAQLQEKDRELASLAKSSSDRITELETQVQEQADELDLLRDDAATLAQTKSALKKAKSRLASVNDLKIVNKELEATNREYLGKIMTFEENIKASESRANSFRAQLNEALAAKLDLGQRLSAAQHEVSNLKHKVEEQTEKAKFAVEQLESLRRSHEHGDGEDSDAGSEASTERVTPALRERLTRLELENERAKKLVAEAGDMSALREQIASLTEELQSSQAAVAASTARVAELEAHHAELNVQHDKMAAENQESLAKAKELAEQLAAEQKKTAELEASNQSKPESDVPSSPRKVFLQELSQARARETKLRKQIEKLKAAAKAASAKAGTKTTGGGAGAGGDPPKSPAPATPRSDLLQELAQARSREATLKSKLEKSRTDRQNLKKGTKKLMVTYKQLREEMIALKKRWQNTEKLYALAKRANSAQAKEDGIMATAFYTLGLVGLSDDSIDTHRGWLTAARQRQRAARSPR